MKLFFRRVFVALAVAVGAASASAKNYEAIWSQDFEDASTYEEGWTFSGGTHQQGSRTLTAGGTSHFLHLTAKSTKAVATLPLDEQCVTATDYRLSFDWFAGMGFNVSTCYLKLFAGDDEVLYIADTNVKSGKNTTAYVYTNGVTSAAAATFTCSYRGGNCTDANNQSYWYRITVAANEEDGLSLTIASQDSAVATVSLAKISDFVNITKIEFRAHSSSYQAYGGIDDISFGTPVPPRTYTWTGAAGDRVWSTPGNWKVGSAAQTECYPLDLDTAVIPGGAGTITAAVGQVVKALTIGDGSKLAFDIGAIAKNEPVTLFSVTEGTCPLTADNVVLTGYASDAYAPSLIADTMKISAILYGKDRFVWSGDGGDSLFANAGNWVYGAEGGPAAVTAPTGNGTVVFPASFASGVAVTFGADTATEGIYFVLDCNVTFSSDGSTMRTIYPWSVTGGGTLSLANRISLQTVTGKGMTVSAGVNVLPSAGDDPWAAYARFYLRGEKSSVTINGVIVGSGYLRLEGDGNPTKYYYLNGDTGGFSGKIYTQYGWSAKKSDECITTRLGAAAALGLGAATLEVAGRVWVTATNDDNTLHVGALSGTGVIDNYNSGTALTLEVGAANADASASVTLTNNYEVGAWTVRKVGTGRQTLSDPTVAYNAELAAGELGVPAGKAFGTVALGGGKFCFAVPYDSPWTNGTACVLFTCTDGIAAGTEVNYVTLDMSAFASTYIPEYDNSLANTLLVTLKPTVSVWNGPVKGLWSEPANWLVNGQTAQVSPGAGDTVEIGANAVIMVSPEQGFGKITADASVTLAVQFTDSSLTFTAPGGFAGTIAVAGPFAVTVEGGVYTATRVPGVFAWWGAAADGQWSTAGNWTVGDYPVAVVPAASDSVTIGKDAVISTSKGDGNVSNLTVNANVTLTGGGALMIGARADKIGISADVAGSGRLTLGGIKLYAGFNKVLVSLPLEIAAETVNQLMCCVTKISGTAYGHGFKLTGKVTGSGKIEITQNAGGNNINNGVELDCDMAEFAGEVEYYQGTSSSGGKITYQMRAVDTIHAQATSSNSCWDIYADHYPDTNVDRISGNYFADADATYRFGSLQLRLPNTKNDMSYCENVTLEVGALDRDSKILYSWKNAKNAGVNWIAPTATWTQDAANQAFLNVTGGGNAFVTSADALPAALTFAGAGGTLKVGYDVVSDSADATAAGVVPVDPSAKLADSTAPIAFDDQGTNATWATAIAASNVGGFTKRGSGRLTLSATPLYTGPTRIEGGSLFVDGTLALGEGSAVVVDDPAAVCKAGTVLAQATSITGKAELVSSSPTAKQYAIRKVNAIVSNKRVVQLKIATSGGIATVFR